MSASISSSFRRLRRAIRGLTVEWMVGRIFELESDEWSPQCALLFTAWHHSRPPVEGRAAFTKPDQQGDGR